ncbi:MAG: glucose dehydrogenase [Dehalococcoidia bacterium]|nr:MAG: glucose dehydrogenase [Dehalococcoidia bacterium]
MGWLVKGALGAGVLVTLIALWTIGEKRPSAAAPPLPSLTATLVASGLTNPTSITGAGDGSGRLFITEQAGTARILRLRNEQVLPVPFLDIRDRVSNGGERGLLSLAFPPGFAQKRYFYAFYTDTTGDLVISRFRLTADPDRADPASEQRVLTIPHREGDDHNGGQLQFGPDGYLYIGTGDGGQDNDEPNNAQNPGVLLGKLLRIDSETGSPLTYTVPASNPRQPGWRPEIWALGLRNPWRFSFDRLTGDLYIGDVGQLATEEIDFQPAGSPGGENYGWHIWEGTRCNVPPCTTEGFTFPIFEYNHPVGISVIGGYVYRGTEFPALQGVYIFADLIGDVWALVRDGGQWVGGKVLELNSEISTLGEDDSANLYLADYTNGKVYRLGLAGAIPQPTATPRVFGGTLRVHIPIAWTITLNGLSRAGR